MMEALLFLLLAPVAIFLGLRLLRLAVFLFVFLVGLACMGLVALRRKLGKAGAA